MLLLPRQARSPLRASFPQNDRRIDVLITLRQLPPTARDVDARPLWANALRADVRRVGIGIQFATLRRHEQRPTGISQAVAQVVSFGPGRPRTGHRSLSAMRRDDGLYIEFAAALARTL